MFIVKRYPVGTFCRSREDEKPALSAEHLVPNEEIEGEHRCDENVIDIPKAPFVECHGDTLRCSTATFRVGEEDGVPVYGYSDQKGGKKRTVIQKSYREWKLGAGIYFIGTFQFDVDAAQVSLSEDAGDNEKAEKSRLNDIDEIVSRIDRGDAKKQGYDKIKPSCFGKSDYAGVGTSSMIDLISSFLLIVSYSSLRMIRWGMLYSASSLMSSGMTKSRPLK